MPDTLLHDLPYPVQVAAGPGPDVPSDVKNLADAIDPKLTPWSTGAGDPATLGIAPGKPGRRHLDSGTGVEYLDIGAAWVRTTPAGLEGDAPAGTRALRSLGAGAGQAAAGDDARLGDARTPTDNSVTAAKVHTSLKPSAGAASGTEALRALGAAAGTAAAGNDSRLSDARTPTAHKATHQPGGTDVLEVDPAFHSLQHGVVSGGQVTWLNANMLRVAAGKGWIQQASGLLKPVSWAQEDFAIPSAANSRIDQLCVWQDGSIVRSASADVAGVTLANRTGATGVGAVGSGYLRLADVISTAAGVANSAAGFRDRRPWAKGAHAVATMAAGGSVVLSNTAYTVIDGSFTTRIELSGAPLELALLIGTVQDSANAAASLEVDFFIEAVAQLGTARFIWGEGASQNIDGGGVMMAVLGAGGNSIAHPGVGSKLIEPRYKVNNWNWNISGKSQFTIRERLTPVANNGTA